MAGEWEDLTLGDLGRVVTGKTPLTAVEGNFGGQIPFVTPSDMDGRKTISTTARYLTETGAASVKGSVIPAGAIMVSCIGSDMGKVVIAGRDCVTNQQINSIVVDDRFSSEFVYYTLSTRKNEIRHQAAGGSAVPILNKGDFSRMEIALPPLAEQKAIAAVLGTLDDKIELNRRMNATLEAMARALFQSWFVDFDPVRRNAKGESQKPEDSLFPDSFEDSIQGSIPAGWRAVTLGNISKNASVTFDFKRTPEAIFVNTGDVLEGDFLHSNRSSHIGLPGQAKKSIRPDDILFSEIRPANKRYAYVDFDSSDYVVSTKFMIIRASEEILPRLLYRILTANETLAEFQLQAESRSGTFPQITFDSISHLPIVLPPMEIQEAFQRAVESIDARIKFNKEESRTLTNIRDTLLPKLLDGSLKAKPQ